VRGHRQGRDEESCVTVPSRTGRGSGGCGSSRRVVKEAVEELHNPSRRARVGIAAGTGTGEDGGA
jgi:hypothetical protein